MTQQTRKQEKSDLEKIVEYLIIYTMVPREKSPIRWAMNKLFDCYSFETEIKGKIYVFDGRHFYVYPAGYELPPGIQMGDKSGPDLLLSVKIDVAPKLFGELWQRVCGQHDEALQEDEHKRTVEIARLEMHRIQEQEKAAKNTQDILRDFQNK